MNGNAMKGLIAVAAILPLLAGCPSASMPTTPSSPSHPCHPAAAPDLAAHPVAHRQVAVGLVVHRARLEVHPAVVRPLAGHRAVAHPPAAVHRAEAHRARAGVRRRGGGKQRWCGMAACRRARGGSGGMENGDSGGSGDGAMAGGDPGFGDSIGGDLSLPSLVDEEPVYTASSTAAAAAVVVRAMAPATGVVAHQAVARVAPAEKLIIRRDQWTSRI